MKTIFKVALTLGLASFAFFANAQTASTTGAPNSPTAVHNVDTLQVDWVTVGSTMPYATNLNNEALETWRSYANAWYLSIGNVVSRARWSVQPFPSGTITDFGNDFENQERIYVHWQTIGQFMLTVQNQIYIGSTPACTTAISGKRVFVLPAPNVLTDAPSITGHDVVLPCDAPDHTVSFRARGVSQMQLRYVVTRRPIAGGVDSIVHTSAPAGAAVTNEPFFTINEVAGGHSFGDAQAMYQLGTGEQVSITIPDLEAGFIYRVRVTGVSDQISRKSFTGDDVFRPANVQAVFAVVPRPTSTVIDHVSNQQGVVTP